MKLSPEGALMLEDLPSNAWGAIYACAGAFCTLALGAIKIRHDAHKLKSSNSHSFMSILLKRVEALEKQNDQLRIDYDKKLELIREEMEEKCQREMERILKTRT